MKPTLRELAMLVEQRARGRCEYCGMSQTLQGATFHLEHVLPKSKGGETNAANLAWCCPSCNLHKADRIDAVDPETQVLAPLFDPRTMQWAEHFRWQGHHVHGSTNSGRATVAALQLNHERRVRIRQVEESLGLFPLG